MRDAQPVVVSATRCPLETTKTVRLHVTTSLRRAADRRHALEIGIGFSPFAKSDPGLVRKEYPRGYDRIRPFLDEELFLIDVV
jgi:hypothetical protein